MFLAPNTRPSVAVRSVQLQLVCGTVCQCQYSLLSLHGHFSTPPKNWTVWAFLQLTPRLSNDFTFPQLFAVAATLKSISTVMLLWHSFLIIIIIIITRCWHVTISCQPDGRPPQPVRPWTFSRGQQCSCFRITVFYGVWAEQQKVCEWGPKIWNI